MSVGRALKALGTRAVIALALSVPVGGAFVASEPSAPPQAPPEAPGAPEASATAAPAKRVVRTFKVYADNWNWTPSALRVKEGDHVVLKLYAYRASRSFVLKAYNLDVHMPQDTEVTAEFDATRKGEFPFRCGRPCGNGCAKLRGTLYVE